MVEMRISNGVIPRAQSYTGYRDSRMRIVRVNARWSTLSERPTGEKRMCQPPTKERSIVITLRGRSRSRRVKYGSQFGPYGMYSATWYPARTSSVLSGSRTPCNIANSNGVGCNFDKARARSIIRPSWLPTAKCRALVNIVSRSVRYEYTIQDRLNTWTSHD